MPLGAGRPAAIDHRGARFDEALEVPPRIADGRAGGDEDRIAAVVPRDAPQPANHVGHRRAEDALIDVELVDHHVAQAPEEGPPAQVVGQDGDVEHVGVGDDQVAALPQHPASVAGGVAVVGVGGDRIPRATPRGGPGPRPARAARSARPPGPGRGPWSGRGRAPRGAPWGRRSAGRRGPAGCSRGSSRRRWA